MIWEFAGPYNNPDLNQHFTQHDSQLGEDELQRIRDYGDALETTNVKLYGKFDDAMVKATGSHFPLNEETRWLYERIAARAREINAEAFRYDLTGFYENFYFLRYEAPGEHFGWHVDMDANTGAPRKLSLTLQLSGPEEYEGGDFEVMASAHHVTAPKGRGLITAFPSYKIHRVTPVTRGVRRALVMFLAGPNFR